MLVVLWRFTYSVIALLVVGTGVHFVKLMLD